ncbi:MAG: hypothetical protein GC205_04175 [Bacteroidetes bacterium]|nr:hypothetical protein [Bacteroidota bacterium]
MNLAPAFFNWRPVRWHPACTGPASLLFGLLLVLLAPCGHSLQAQKPDRDLVRAEKLYAIGRYHAAIPYYERSLQRAYDAVNCARLAGCYHRQGAYLLAEHWYKQAVLADALPPEYFKQYAEVLRNNGKADQALEWFERYDRYAGNKGAHKASYALSAEEDVLPQEYRVALLDGNTSASEIVPVAYQGHLVFASNRGGGNAGSRSPQDGAPYYDLYITPLDESERTSPPARIRGAIHSAWHDAGFSPDPATGDIWFTRTSSNGGKRVRDGQGVVHTALYTAHWKRDKLKAVKRFAKINRQYTAAHPSLTPDGLRLYFAANLQDGYGGMDIWYCDRTEQNGTYAWSDPVNAGSRINTPGDEVFPFAPRLDRLYFASDGHPGIGGLDIFQVDFSGGSWEAVRHLPAPVNSPRDDFGVYVRNNQGFFSSDRIGGMGGDDLYAFERIRVRAGVYVLNLESGQPISGARVEWITDGQNNRQTTTDARGFAFADLPPGVDYYFNIQKSGFYELVFTETRNKELFTAGLKPLIEPTPQPDPSELAAPAGSGLDQNNSDAQLRYRIRIGVYRKPNMEKLSPLETIAPLFSVPGANSVSAFYIGPFFNAEEAQEALIRVRELRFTDAILEEWVP